MNVTEALEILREGSKQASPFQVTLACGFTALHLQTFLAAHLQVALPNRRVTVVPGLYGDLVGTVEKSAERQVDNLVIVVEWSDLDPRLGFRASPIWDSNTLREVLSFARMGLERLGNSMAQLPNGIRAVLSMPTLPLPPLFYTSRWQMGESEAVLAEISAEFATKIARSGVPVVNTTRLAEESPVGERYDLKSDLLLGLPYTVKHADALAAGIASLLCPLPAKKGIITDLDDTLWEGLIGEVGPDAIHWHLDRHSGLHALYQVLLASLSEQGVLVGVASKNDPSVVERAFQRSDILLRPERVFPMEVHWNAKSISVDRILRAWNISAESVVFVDDSPMELAEVAAAHPGIECVQFRRDYDTGYALLHRIRDLFGRQTLSSEDSIRLASIKHSAEFQKASGGSISEIFLEQTKPVVHFDFQSSTVDSRALELVNKTNQFNLNGVRLTTSDWASALAHPNVESMVVSYQDRFGALGKIAVMLGNRESETLRVRVWVMSCRAFSRRIEYLCLRTCFQRHPLRRIEFDFVATDKNAAFRDFLKSLLGQSLEVPAVLTREQFEQVCPPLYHTIGEERRAEVDERGSAPVSKMF